MTKHKLIAYSVLYSYLILAGCSMKRKDKVVNTLLLECYSLYNNETIYINVNDRTVFCDLGIDPNNNFNIKRTIFLNDTIKTIHIFSKHKQDTIINKYFINKSKANKYYIFISPPYPDTITQLQLSPEYKPSWKYIPIETSKRRIIFDVDTIKEIIL